MNLIIISGAPGTGKTTISLELAKRLKYRLISKDDFKLFLFEKYGFNSIESKKKLDEKAEKMFWSQIKECICLNENIIVDKWLQGISLFPEITYNVKLYYINLVCDPIVCHQRYNQRLFSNHRPISFKALNIYPVVDKITVFEKPVSIETIKEKLSRDVNLDGIENFLEIDTTYIQNDFSNIIEEILSLIK